MDLTGSSLATVVTNLSITDEASAIAALETAALASAFISTVDGEIEAVSSARSTLGATQNRLEHTLKHVNVSQENLAAAESNIRDVDMAKEIVKQSAASIKEQAAQAMLAQANQASQGVLQLLR